jgi:hypothetical protein
VATYPRPLCHRLVGRPVSESGTLCHGDGAHGRGGRRRRGLMLAILLFLACQARRFKGRRSIVLTLTLRWSYCCRSPNLNLPP